MAAAAHAGRRLPEASSSKLPPTRGERLTYGFSSRGGSRAARPSNSPGAAAPPPREPGRPPRVPLRERSRRPARPTARLRPRRAPLCGNQQTEEQSRAGPPEQLCPCCSVQRQGCS